MDRRKALIIFGAAWVSAALLTWFLWSRTSAPKQEKTISIAAVSHDMAAGTRLQKTDLKMISVPEKDLPKAAFVDPGAAVGRVLIFPISTNEPLTGSKVGSITGAEGFTALIEPGMRGISVPISDLSGVAGLVQPRSHVDVLFTRSGSMTEALTTTILEDVVVLSIGKTTEVQPSTPGAANTAGAGSSSQTRAVTLLVNPDEARKLELAKNQGRLSLALRNPQDRSRLDTKDAVTAESIDPFLFVRRKPTQVRVGMTSNGSLKAVGEVVASAPPRPKKDVKPEPVKPRLVVDVFRGEKHVQESFQ